MKKLSSEAREEIEINITPRALSKCDPELSSLKDQKRQSAYIFCELMEFYQTGLQAYQTDTAWTPSEKRLSALNKLQDAISEIMEMEDVLLTIDDNLPLDLRVHFKDGKPICFHGYKILKELSDAAEKVKVTPSMSGPKSNPARLAVLNCIVKAWIQAVGDSPPLTVNSSFDACAKVVFKELFPDYLTPASFRDDLKRLKKNPSLIPYIPKGE